MIRNRLIARRPGAKSALGPQQGGTRRTGKRSLRRGPSARRAGSRSLRRGRGASAVGRRKGGRRPGVGSAGVSAAPRGIRRWHDAGFLSGVAWRTAYPAAGVDDAKFALHDHVNRAFAPGGEDGAAPGKRAETSGAVCAYAEGFMRGTGFSFSFEPVPLRGTASAVVCAGPNEAALEAVLTQLDRLPLREWIVVVPEQARTAQEIAARYARSVVVRTDGWTGGAAGCALGAERTGADIVLFVDGEQPAPAETLVRFLRAVDGGMDAALNARASGIAKFHQRQPADRMNEFLNFSLGRPDLGVRSLSALPFALSRRAINAIGAHALALPAKAHALCILRGLRVGIGGSVPWRAMPDPGRPNPDPRDLLEAWREAMALRGGRLSFPDRRRNRAAAGEPAP